MSTMKITNKEKRNRKGRSSIISKRPLAHSRAISLLRNIKSSSISINKKEVNEIDLNKKSSKPDMQIDKTSISEINSSFPVESQLSLGSRANHTLLKNDIECQVKKTCCLEKR